MNEQSPIRPRRLGWLFVDVCVVLVALAMLGAWLVPIDPEQAPSFAAVEMLASHADALRFPMGAALAPFLLVLLFGRRWGRVGVTLGVAALAIVPSLGWAAPTRLPQPGGEALTIMSVNLSRDRASDERLLEAIERRAPDVLLLLEYTAARAQRIGAQLHARWPHVHEITRPDSFGLALFSAQPWKTSERVQLGDGELPQLRVVLELGGQDVALYCIHPMPPGPGHYTRHRVEVADLLGRLDGERLPTVLVGDFNFVDHGACGEALHERGYFAAHAFAGTGRGATWLKVGWMKHLPGIRLDYIYVGRGLTATHAWTGDALGSDHLPVGATVRLAEAGE